MPGERVELSLAPDSAGGIPAVFLFRTTAVACFDPISGFDEADALIELKIRADGSLRDSLCRTWFVLGRDRGTRMPVPGQPIYRHFEAWRRGIR
ncbi:MAG: hypothetical protein V4502_01745 [Pseudomonadota bacterium]